MHLIPQEQMSEKQLETARKFKEHFKTKYAEEISVEEANLYLRRLADYVLILAKMKREQEARGIFLDDEEDDSKS